MIECRYAVVEMRSKEYHAKLLFSSPVLTTAYASLSDYTRDKLFFLRPAIDFKYI